MNDCMTCIYLDLCWLYCNWAAMLCVSEFNNFTLGHGAYVLTAFEKLLHAMIEILL